MRSPSPVQNQPLKSAHHTRFGPSACAKGSVYGAVFRRFLRATTNPSRFSNSPTVLAAGHFRPGSSRSKMRFNLRGPQRICACRSSSTVRSISVGVWFGCRSAARFSSTSPATPTCRYRRNHAYPVSRAIPKLWQSSVMVCSSRSYSKTNRSFSSITLLAFHGMRSVLLALATACSVRDPPGLFCQGCSRSVPGVPPSPPIFSIYWNQWVSEKACQNIEFTGLIWKIFKNKDLAVKFRDSLRISGCLLPLHLHPLNGSSCQGTLKNEAVSGDGALLDIALSKNSRRVAVGSL